MAKPAFYIEQLIVSGPKVEPAVIDFSEGLNIITGASNTGKSLIVDCIDYAFGYKKQPRNNHDRTPTLIGYGYESVRMYLRTERGTVCIERAFGENKVIITGDDPFIDPVYGKISLDAESKSLSVTLLKLLGVEEPHRILSSVGGNTNRLTWRGIMHLFFVRQPNIMEENSIYINPDVKTVAQTSSPAALLFLLDGINADDIPSAEELKIMSERSDAVVEYIQKHIDTLGKRRADLSNKKSFTNNTVSETTISEYENAIMKLQEETASAIDQSKALMEQIYECNGELSKYSIIRKHFATLKNQYGSDAHRLTFISEGNSILQAVCAIRNCPFCNGVLPADSEETFADSLRISTEHIISHAKDLEAADNDAFEKQSILQTRLEELESEKKKLDHRIENELRPTLKKLQTDLHDYRAAVQVDVEIEMLEAEEKRLNSEIWDIESVKEEQPKKKYYISEQYGKDTVEKLEENLRAILKYIDFPMYDAARFSLDTFDLQFGSKTKGGYMGGGYTGILNSVMIIGLMENLIENGMYAPGLSVIDSPLSMLSESEYREGALIKQKFLDYLYEHRRYGQVIIVEQKEKMPPAIDEWIKKAQSDQNLNIYDFSGVKEHGRYGFLPGVTNDK